MEDLYIVVFIFEKKKKDEVMVGFLFSSCVFIDFSAISVCVFITVK